MVDLTPIMLSISTPGVEEEVINFLKNKKEEKGRNFVITVLRMKKEIDTMTPQMMGRIMHNLNDKGIVRCIKRNGPRIRYITQFD